MISVFYDINILVKNAFMSGEQMQTLTNCRTDLGDKAAHNSIMEAMINT